MYTRVCVYNIYMIYIIYSRKMYINKINIFDKIYSHIIKLFKIITLSVNTNYAVVLTGTLIE